MLRLRKALPRDDGDTVVRIPSCRATISAASVATVKGGLVCNIDGASNGLATTPNDQKERDGFHSELYRW